MILISHRGNINGRVESLENNPEYIRLALELGYQVEIDVWFKNNKFYLGHDEPQYEIDRTFLTNTKLWCHAKNVAALQQMMNYDIHYFWHEEDTLTLTSKNYIWVYPGKQPIKDSIAVMPEIFNDDLSQCLGVCSDNIINYKS